MSSKNTISGHVRNIANFDRMISICSGIGEVYQPKSDQLAIAKLQLLHAAVDTAKTELENVMPNYTGAVTTAKLLLQRWVNWLPASLTRW